MNLQWEKKKNNNKEKDLWVISEKKNSTTTTNVMRGNFKGIKIESFYFLEIQEEVFGTVV